MILFVRFLEEWSQPTERHFVRSSGRRISRTEPGAVAALEGALKEAVTNGQKVLLLTDELPQMLSDQIDSKDETVKQLTMAVS